MIEKTAAIQYRTFFRYGLLISNNFLFLIRFDWVNV